jgi:hypothetical protein
MMIRYPYLRKGSFCYLTDSSQEMVKFIRELKKGDFFKEFTLEVLHIVLFDEETDVKLTTIADHLHPDDDAPETMVYYLEERFGIDYLNATKGE